jgi:hypothetical protein
MRLERSRSKHHADTTDHHILSTAKMAERMNTSLLHRLADLPAVLQDRMSKRLPSTRIM